VLSELKRRGARKKLQRLCYLGKDLKDDDVVGAVQKNAPSPWGYAHTVVCMCLEAASELPSRADMFKPKPGEWDCQTCKTLARYPPTATIRCVLCWEKPGAPAQAAVGGSRLDRLIETYDAIRAAQAAQDALRAEWKEKEKLRPLSQKVAVA
jgi:LSD1 subclass zinc finger protein